MRKFTTETRRAWRRDAIYRVFLEKRVSRKGIRIYRIKESTGLQRKGRKEIRVRLAVFASPLQSLRFSSNSQTPFSSKRRDKSRLYARPSVAPWLPFFPIQPSWSIQVSFTNPVCPDPFRNCHQDTRAQRFTKYTVKKVSCDS